MTTSNESARETSERLAKYISNPKDYAAIPAAADAIESALLAERAAAWREVEEWARERKRAETEHRPDVNIHKRTFVETWDQVIRAPSEAERAEMKRAARTTIAEDEVCHAAASASLAEKDAEIERLHRLEADGLRRLHEIIGLANDDDGPPMNEWDLGDPAQAVRSLRKELERAREKLKLYDEPPTDLPPLTPQDEKRHAALRELVINPDLLDQLRAELARAREQATAEACKWLRVNAAEAALEQRTRERDEARVAMIQPIMELFGRKVSDIDRLLNFVEARTGTTDPRAGMTRLDSALSGQRDLIGKLSFERGTLEARASELEGQLKAAQNCIESWRRGANEVADELHRAGIESLVAPHERVRILREERDAARAELARAREQAIRDAANVATREMLDPCGGSYRADWNAACGKIAQEIDALHRAARPELPAENPCDCSADYGEPHASNCQIVTGEPSRGGARGAEEFGEDETRWLIERGQAVGHSPTVWWTGSQYGYEGWKDGWTEDANAALFYESEAAAKAAADTRWKGWPRPNLPYTITAHRWLPPRQPAPDAEE